MKKDMLIFIRHVLDSMGKIELFMRGVKRDDFFNNEEKQSAVIRQIEIIGEAVKNLPNSFRKKYPEIPWKDIVGMRDKLIHHYFGVNLENIWKVINEDIPVLKEQMKKILEKEDK